MPIKKEVFGNYKKWFNRKMMMPKMSKNCRKPRARKPVEALTRLGVPFIQ